ncbi:universal stress protein [Stappia taiwanensis]|uniref:Universal stress protein n=1 Tax=Stappia taiwanensis TaxID=992267 RepID=A0A838XX68_9HYPH|nr:universal stress protein [Stappia taiwanensis]MBA4613066.1 universal stress protein [Stappia taiwanensis]GGF01507.1 universal stress protein UspA [Stappia taiwanensis]
MTKLIALVDGSVYSHSVCDHAAWIAGRTGAAVEILHVLSPRQAAEGEANLSGNIALGARSALLQELSSLDEQMAKLAQKQGRAILEDAKAVVEAAGAETVTTRLRAGDIVETVAESEADAALIVIGKRGEAADFARLHLGSNLERIVRSSHKPVFVTSRAFQPIERFLIAFDGGPSALKAVDYVARSPLFAGLDCHLLMVGAETAEARAKLDAARATLEGGGLSVTATLTPGQPEAVITQTVEKEDIDLLIMGAYGHSRIRTLIIGSTTSEMVRSCKTPVLMFR